MANHYFGNISFRLARERLLAATEFWSVTDAPDDKSLRARFRTTGEGWHGISLYYNNDIDEPVKSENLPRPFVFVALELTIGSVMEDIYGSGRGWYRLSFRISDDEYRAMVTEMKGHLGDRWIEPVPGYLTDAELNSIEDRLEQLCAVHLQEPATSEAVDSVLRGEARASVEAERDDPSLVWADWLARGLPADKAAYLQGLVEEDHAREAERKARGKTSPPLDPEDFFKRLGEI